MTAEQLVEVARSLPGHGAVGGTPQHHRWVVELYETGYDQVDYFRARLWLRRGKPGHYRWDWSAR